jgi:hypothetical protein
VSSSCLGRLKMGAITLHKLVLDAGCNLGIVLENKRFILLDGNKK